MGVIQRRGRATVWALGMVLLGCGGGGEPEEAARLRLSGTAATGLALAQAQISAKCQRGQGSATSLADGSYSLQIPEGGLPCVLRAQPADGSAALYSLAVGEGGQAVANLTPLSDWVTVRVARGEASGLFDRFDATAAARLNRDRLGAAQADVRSLLAGVADLRGVADLVSTPLRAATPAQPAAGDAQDRMLDEIKKRVGAEHRGQLRAALASGSPPADPGNGSFTPTLSLEPRELQLEPGASRLLMAELNYPKGQVPLRRPVSWKLLDANGGKVDAVTGLYQAPDKPGSYRVRATREDHPQVGAELRITVLPFRTLEQSAHSGVRVAQNLVIRDASAWAELWGRHVAGQSPAPALPALDFSKEMVLALFAGPKSHACYGLQMLELREQAGRWQAVYRETQPAAGQPCPTAQGSPALMLRLPRSTQPVDFVAKPG